MFKDELQTEWQRLNPVYTSPDNGFFKAMWRYGMTQSNQTQGEKRD